MAYDTIILEEADGIATITLNRPAALNALSTGMAHELSGPLDDLRDRARRAYCR